MLLMEKALARLSVRTFLNANRYRRTMRIFVGFFISTLPLFRVADVKLAKKIIQSRGE
jgi:hypothetical protein